MLKDQAIQNLNAKKFELQTLLDFELYLPVFITVQIIIMKYKKLVFLWVELQKQLFMSLLFEIVSYYTQNTSLSMQN